MVLDAALVLGAIAFATVAIHQGLATAAGPDLLARAQDALHASQPARTSDLIQDILAADPLDAAALRTLGFALALEGRDARAEAILDFVARRSWRDGPAQAWMFERRLSQGRFDEAFAHADALLRRDDTGTISDAVFPVLKAAASYEAPRGALVEALSHGPPWRKGFLQSLAAGGEPSAAYEVFLGLRRTRSGPRPAEFAPLIDRLVGDRQYDEALAKWMTLSGARNSDALLRDGDFTATTDRAPAPFAWSVAEGGGASSEIRPSPESTGGALWIDYDGYSIPRLPRQLLVLAPGAYRLTWRQRIEPDADGGRLAWRIRCAEDSRVLASQPAAQPVPGIWRSFSIDFEAPAAGCAGQWLQLEAEPGDRRVDTVVWYRAFRIAPL
jgi:hypothetical protein